MSHRLTKQAVTTYTPAVEEVVAQPAYWGVTQVAFTVTKRTGSNASVTPVYGQTTDPVSGKTTYGVVGISQNAGGTGGYYQTVEYFPVYTYYPAVVGVEGREATTTTDNQAGWNAGAHSVDSTSDDFYMSFDLPPAMVGALVGLVDPGATVGNYSAISHGLLLANGVLKVVESGVEIGNGPSVSGTSSCIIRRVGGVVTYQIGGWKYTSTKSSTGAKNLGAVLYSAPDYVDNPAIGDITSMESAGDWGWATDGYTYIPAKSAWGWAGSSTMGDGSVVAAFPLTMRAADFSYGEVVLELDAPEVSAQFGFTTVESVGISVKFDFSLAAQAVDVGMASVAMDFPTTMHAADFSYGEVVMELDGPDVWALSDGSPTDQADIVEGLSVASTITSDASAIAIITGKLSIGDSFDVLFSVDALLAEALLVYDEVDVTAIIEAMLTNNLRFNDSASSVSTTLLQYATNLMTGAVSRYDGYDFAGFARDHGQPYTFGYRRDGVYRLSGATDDGDLISALIDFAAEDFGTGLSKRLDSIYFGLSTDGDVFVRLVDDLDRAVVYRTRQRRDQHRTDPKQGFASRYWRMRLEIVDASIGTLDNVEWLPISTGRRITT